MLKVFLKAFKITGTDACKYSVYANTLAEAFWPSTILKNYSHHTKNKYVWWYLP